MSILSCRLEHILSGCLKLVKCSWTKKVFAMTLQYRYYYLYGRCPTTLISRQFGSCAPVALVLVLFILQMQCKNVKLKCLKIGVLYNFKHNRIHANLVLKRQGYFALYKDAGSHYSGIQQQALLNLLRMTTVTSGFEAKCQTTLHMLHSIQPHDSILNQ